ncbi:ATPase, T2SS/T4P/T4SS family [Micrococcus sp. 2A]|uniref:CpaF family protein n=1 Tax=Micrococcus sp. 2A TaxID=3142261 RepID=UPI0031B9FD1C
MRPWVPDAPPRPRRARPSVRSGLHPPRPGHPPPAAAPLAAASPPPAAAPLAAASPGPDDAAALRRRIAEQCAEGDPATEADLRPLIERVLADAEAQRRADAMRPAPWWRRIGRGAPDPDRPWTPPAPAVREAQARALEEELAGFGPLAPWVGVEGVTDVLVDGGGAVWTDGAGGLIRRPARLDPEASHALAVRLLGQAGRRLDGAVPMADARVGGVRVHAVLPPVSGGGTVLSLRVPARRARSLAELAESWPDGGLWAEAVQWLVLHRATVFISGATGTGKTTMLSAALSEVSAHERIITVEDTLEAAPEHPHVVALQCRAANEEGAGEVALPELIRHALRMRPDRLVVGECRGAEVTDVLTALNTGHQGAWGTLHANAAADVPARLTAMASLAGWSPAAVDAQARAGVDAVLHVVRDVHGRHPVELAVPADAPGPLALVPALTWEDGTADDGGGAAGRTVEGPGLELLRARLEGRHTC